MCKASIHAGLRDAIFCDCAVFMTDVDYYEMSSKISPSFLENFLQELIHRLRNNTQTVEEIDKQVLGKPLVCDACSASAPRTDKGNVAIRLPPMVLI